MKKKTWQKGNKTSQRGNKFCDFQLKQEQAMEKAAKYSGINGKSQYKYEVFPSSPFFAL